MNPESVVATRQGQQGACVSSSAVRKPIRSTLLNLFDNLSHFLNSEFKQACGRIFLGL